MTDTPTTTPISHRVLVATSQTDVAMMFLGWFAKHGMYVGLVTDIAHLNDTGRFPQAPEGLVLDDSMGAAQLASITRGLRQNPAWAKTIIVAAGTFTEEQEVDMLKAGANEVVGKPLRMTAMLFRLQRFLKARHG
jgi:DNA-binding response OmpR family regulator